MAPRITDTRDPETIIDAGFDDVSAIHEENKQVEDEIRAAIGADPDDVEYLIKVYEVKKGESKEPYMFDLHVSELEGLTKRLKDTYGGGKYRVTVYKNGKIFTRKLISISELISPKTNQEPDNLSVMALALERSNNKFLEELRRTNLVPQTPQNPMEMMVAFMGALAQMKEFFQPEKPAKSEIETLIEGIKIAQTLSTDNKSDSNFLDVIRDVIKSPEILDAVKKQTETQSNLATNPQNSLANPPNIPHPNQVRAAQQTYAPRHNSQPQNQTGDGEMLDLNQPEAQQLLKVNIAYWTERARENADPNMYADLAIETFNVELLDAIVNHDNVMGLLQFFHPEAAPFMPWFETFFTRIKNVLTEEFENDVPTPDVNVDPQDENGVSNTDGSAVNADGNTTGSSGGENNPPANDGAG